MFGLGKLLGAGRRSATTGVGRLRGGAGKARGGGRQSTDKVLGGGRQSTDRLRGSGRRSTGKLRGGGRRRVAAELDKLRGGGRRRLATSAAAVLAVASLSLFAVGFSRQRHAPQPPASVAISGPVVPTTVPSAASGGPPAPARAPSPPSPASPKPASLSPSPTIRPTAISIPAIGVHHTLLSLGLNSDGTLQVPSMTDVAYPAWYKNSPVPGRPGPAVILGHIDSTTGAEGVFYSLGALRPGDTVAVTRSDGSTAAFRVDGVDRYAKDTFPTLTVYGNTPNPQLRLITCGGRFDHRRQHYLDNIVVFATLTGVRSG